MKTRVIACYSRGTPYEQEAQAFKDNLARLGMPGIVEGFPDQGNWYDNTRMKAVFIERQRRLRRGPLLYIDVDAIIHQPCLEYFDGLSAAGFDFGAHFFQGPAKGYNRAAVKAEGWRLLSGTLFLGDTEPCRRLLQTWLAINDACRASGYREGGGQKNLWFALTHAEKAGLKVARLPGRFCYVFDKPWAYPANEPQIIVHLIASRANRDPNKRGGNRPGDRQLLARQG